MQVRPQKVNFEAGTGTVKHLAASRVPPDTPSILGAVVARAGAYCASIESSHQTAIPVAEFDSAANRSMELFL